MLECFFDKVTGLKASNFINKRLQRRCFPVNIARFLRNIFSKDTSRRLLQKLLEISYKFYLRERNKIDLFCKQII